MNPETPASPVNKRAVYPLYRRRLLTAVLLFLMSVLWLTAGCTPTVQVAPPDKPIEINLNVNIEHRVKVEIDKDLEQAFDKNSDIF